MQHGFITRSIELEHGSANSPDNRATAEFSGAVEVASLIHDQTCSGECPIGRVLEAIKHGFITRSIELEHGSAAITGVTRKITALVSGAIKVARLIHHEVCQRVCPIRAT